MHGLGDSRAGKSKKNQKISSLSELGLDIHVRRRIFELCITKTNEKGGRSVTAAIAKEAYEQAKEEHAKVVDNKPSSSSTVKTTTGGESSGPYVEDVDYVKKMLHRRLSV